MSKVKKISPQCSILLAHLMTGACLSQRTATMDFKIAALPRRIADLKELGYDIKSELVRNPLTKQRYARYTLNTKAKV